MGYRYELREIADIDYNSHADVSLWDFTNGVSSSTSPAGHSDKRMFPAGTVVLCRLEKATDTKGKKGYFLEGFAKVTEFSKSGRPIEFGDPLDNRARGRYWRPPLSKDIIYDERKRGKVKKL